MRLASWHFRQGSARRCRRPDTSKNQKTLAASRTCSFPHRVEDENGLGSSNKVKQSSMALCGCKGGFRNQVTARQRPATGWLPSYTLRYKTIWHNNPFARQTVGECLQISSSFGVDTCKPACMCETLPLITGDASFTTEITRTQSARFTFFYSGAPSPPHDFRRKRGVIFSYSLQLLWCKGWKEHENVTPLVGSVSLAPSRGNRALCSRITQSSN